MTLTLGVDLDGVVFDLMTPLLAQYNKDYDDDMTREDITNFRFEKDRFKCGRLAYNYLYDPRIQFASPFFEGAEKVLKAFMLHDDIDVIFATATSRAVMPAKLAKIESAFPSTYYPYGFYLGRDKTKVDCDVFIEDAAHNVLSMLNKNKQVIMPDRPWNREALPNIHHHESWFDEENRMLLVIRSLGWEHIRKLVLELV